MARELTVSALIAILEKCDPSALILSPAPDHSYQHASASVATALYDEDAGWTEDHGEDATPESEYGKRCQVVIIS